MNANAIIYAAVSKADALRYVPREVLAEAVDLSCGKCKAAVVAIAASWKRTVAISRQTNRPIAVLCQKCVDSEASQQDLLVLYEPDALDALVRRNVERN
jgi:hypothetical protein